MTELKTGLNRRKFLNTAGGGILGLPWLESLALAKGSKPAQPAKRMAFYYLPNGITRRGFFPGEGDRPLPKFAGQNNVWRLCISKDAGRLANYHSISWLPTGPKRTSIQHSPQSGCLFSLGWLT